MAPFYGRVSTASRLQPLRGGSLLFTTQFPEIPGTLVFSMLDKLLLTFVTDGIIIKITVGTTHIMKIACKNICMITICLVITIFLIWSQ